MWDEGLHWSHGGKLGVLLKLCWYSEFLLTRDGTSCQVSLGQLVPSMDVQGGSYLVAMTGGWLTSFGKGLLYPCGPGQLCSCWGFNFL